MDVNNLIVNVTKLEENGLSSESRQFIENQKMVIKSIVASLGETLDLSNLKEIVIPTDYEEEVFRYQRQLGYIEHITSNEFSKAIGQMLIDKSNPICQKYTIFFNSELAHFLFQENLIDIAASSQGLKREVVVNVRDNSLKFFIHELCHVHEAEQIFHRKVKLIDKPNRTVMEQMISFSYVLWQEYYATRIPAKMIGNYQNSMNSQFYRWKDLEKEIAKNHYEFCCQNIDKDNFFRRNSDIFRTILIECTYYLANLYSLPDEIAKVKLNEDLGIIVDLKLAEIMPQLSIELNTLFKDFDNWTDYMILKQLSVLVMRYFSSFGINFHDSEQGLLFEIDYYDELYKQYEIIK